MPAPPNHIVDFLLKIPVDWASRKNSQQSSTSAIRNGRRCGFGVTVKLSAKTGFVFGAITETRGSNWFGCSLEPVSFGCRHCLTVVCPFAVVPYCFWHAGTILVTGSLINLHALPAAHILILSRQYGCKCRLFSDR